MDRVTRIATQQIVSQFKDWVKSLAQKSEQLRTPADTAALKSSFAMKVCK